MHRQEQNRTRMASMRESAAPRVWHFSAFHVHRVVVIDGGPIGACTFRPTSRAHFHILITNTSHSNFQQEAINMTSSAIWG